MRLEPSAVPQICRDAVQQLIVERDVEVEPMRVADLETDLSAIMREYLIGEERVNRATREALERRGLNGYSFEQVKREMADVRGFKLGAAGVEWVVDQMIEFLLISRNVEEVFSDDDVLRPKILAVMKKHLDIADARVPPARSGGGSAPPSSFHGEPSGGMPAEARVSDAPPRSDPPGEDPDRREADATDGSDVG